MHIQTVGRITKKELTDMQQHKINYYRAVHPNLTEPELRVLALILEDKSNSQIAELYGCTIRNVEKHRLQIGKKLRTSLSLWSMGERVSSQNDSSTVGGTGAETLDEEALQDHWEVLQNALFKRKAIRARSRKTSGNPSVTHSHRRQTAPVEVAGTGSHRPSRSSGRWLLPGVLFQLQETASVL
jgi:DNA-binding CsgD family transcriptional regulator